MRVQIRKVLVICKYAIDFVYRRGDGAFESNLVAAIGKRNDNVIRGLGPAVSGY